MATNAVKQAVCCCRCEALLDSSARVFPTCSHILCQTCCQRLERKPLKNKSGFGVFCPKCQFFEEEESLLVVNEWILKDLLGAVNNVGSVIECEGCRKHQGSYECSTCDVGLCYMCQVYHVKQGHELARKAVSSHQLMCTQHPDYSLEMSCMDCNQTICGKCKFQDHDNHTSETIGSALVKNINLFAPVMKNISKRLEHRTRQLDVIDKMCTELSNNEKLEHAQLQAHKDNLIEDFTRQINASYQQIKNELSNVTQKQLATLEHQRKEISGHIQRDGGVFSWVNSAIDYSDGAPLLKELQSGVLQSVKKMEQGSEKTDVKQVITVSKFNRNELVLPKPIVIGKVTTMLQNTCTVPHVVESQKATKIGIRETTINIGKLSSYIGQVEHTIKVNISAYRLCLFHDKIWIPCSETNVINVFPLLGVEEQVETLLDLGDVLKPLCLHPLTNELMILAAGSGLYTINASGHVAQKVYDGSFCDVFVTHKQVAALETVENKVLIWSLPDLSDTPHSVDLSALNSESRKTILLYNDHIYVSDALNNHIVKYTMAGDVVQKFGEPGKELGKLNQPYICAVDPQGNLLIADTDNYRLQVMNSYNSKKWELGLKIYKPLDAVFLKNSIYILHADGKKLSVYPL